MILKSFVDLRITSDYLNLQEISENIQLRPSNAGKKGDVIINKKYGKSKTVHQEDYWIAGLENKTGETPEQMIERFLSSLLPAANYLNELSAKAKITFWVSIFPEEEQMNLHLSSTALSNLSKLGIDLDCSVMFFKQLYNSDH